MTTLRMMATSWRSVVISVKTSGPNSLMVVKLRSDARGVSCAGRPAARGVRRAGERGEADRHERLPQRAREGEPRDVRGAVGVDQQEVHRRPQLAALHEGRQREDGAERVD